MGKGQKWQFVLADSAHRIMWLTNTAKRLFLLCYLRFLLLLIESFRLRWSAVQGTGVGEEAEPGGDSAIVIFHAWKLSPDLVLAARLSNTRSSRWRRA
jgi:hypothetical protein